MNAQTDEAGLMAGSYLAMAQLFSYPNEQTWQRLVAHGLVDAAIGREALEAEYLAAFELGRATAAVPLYEGLHRGGQGREGVLEELLRFFEFFDVKLSDSDREFPDHLVTELEFLAWLCLQEQEARSEERDAASFQRAARDFLDRHLAAWLPEFRRKLAATETAYAQYVPMLEGLVANHRSRLGEQLLETGEKP